MLGGTSVVRDIGNWTSVVGGIVVETSAAVVGDVVFERSAIEGVVARTSAVEGVVVGTSAVGGTVVRTSADRCVVTPVVGGMIPGISVV